MAHRYRMSPTSVQESVMIEWCGHARWVWNRGLEQRSFVRPGWPSLSGYDQNLHLTQARADFDWLAAGPSVVQRQAILDLDQAFRNWWAGTHHRPTPRKKGRDEGFAIRDLAVHILNRKWATVYVPKLGPVRFRLHRPMPTGAKSARVTLDRAGRWHVSFASIPVQIAGPGDQSIVGVDRGVAIPFACSDGRDHYEMRISSDADKMRKLRLQRRLARQQKESNRRSITKAKLARLAARDADRRKDAIEKATTDLARTCDIVRIENLSVKNMTRSARGTIKAPGKAVAQKAGLNRSILEQCWGMFARRLADKIGDRLELVTAAYTSQRCSCCKHVDREARESQAVFRCRACGYTDNADVNAAKNIAAGHAVNGRGGNRAIRRPVETSSTKVA